MRTLQEKYNGIQEGKFSKDHFLTEARMQHPNLVTRFNGYDDAVQILKNRGMIQEDYSKILELPDGNYFAIDGDWEDNYQGNSGLFFTIQGSNIYDKNGKTIQSSPREFLSQFTPEEIVKVESIEEEVDTRDLKNVKLKNGKIYRNVRFHLPNDPKSFVTSDGGYMINQDIANVVHADQEIKEEVGQNELLDQLDNLTPAQILKLVGFLGKDALKAFVGKLETMVPKDLKEARLTNKSLTDYRYKPTNDMDKYPYEQILRGLRVELEGLGVNSTPTPEEYTKALAKVLKNLEKDTIFYTNQLAGTNKKVDLHDKMVDVTAKNSVDTFNGLKKAQLKEAIKGVIKNILSEGNEFGEGEGVYEMYGEEEEEEDDIPHPLGYEDQDEIDYDDENFSDPFIDGDLEEATDTEADRNMVRKFMTMYETEPSKFEKLHKQAQVQASTTEDTKFKHLLSLINRAKAGALQALSNQDRRQADSEGMDESISLKDII